MAVQILGKPWDTITGCTKISAGCRECYAERVTEWINRLGNTDKYEAGFRTVVCHDETLALSSKARKPKTYFVNSMADTFHKDVPDEFIRKMFDVMTARPQHTFQLLTKRTDRMRFMSSALPYRDNIWQGVSVEDNSVLHRIDDLRTASVVHRFIMFEPLIGRIGRIDLSGIEWVIVGGESGGGNRTPFGPWIRTGYERSVTSVSLPT